MKIVDRDAAEDRAELREAAKKVSIEPPERKTKLTNQQIAAFWYARKRRQRRGGPAPN